MDSVENTPKRFLFIETQTIRYYSVVIAETAEEAERLYNDGIALKEMRPSATAHDVVERINIGCPTPDEIDNWNRYVLPYPEETKKVFNHFTQSI